MKRMNFQGRREKRQLSAKARQEKCATLSPVFRLAKLDELGLSAKRERAKLAKLLAK